MYKEKSPAVQTASVDRTVQTAIRRFHISCPVAHTLVPTVAAAASPSDKRSKELADRQIDNAMQHAINQWDVPAHLFRRFPKPPGFSGPGG
jgi:hypothetical protein